MPELPEVQTVVNTLRPVAVGRRILSVELRRDDILTPEGIDLPKLLRRRVITDISRRGKRIVFTLDNANQFYIHLGMTGRLTVHDRATEYAAHTHLMIGIDRGRELRFSDPRRFGGIWWMGADAPPDAMGPEPLLIRRRQLARRLARTSRPIKNALMDQRVIAGLGNIYVDESLFTAGIHPLTPTNTLEPEDVARLNRAIKLTLRRALRHRGSTLRDYRDANGDSGAFQKLHRVYDRKAQPCTQCRTAIKRIVLGGRSTHFCPKCQQARSQPAPRNV